MASAVVVAMREALRHLKHVENHLRKHNQPNAANNVGKLSVEISQAVQEAMAYIPQCDIIDIVVRIV
ncbi:hypothetical protein BDW68DRAFT_153357 [Aspergillus falconensis]